MRLKDILKTMFMIFCAVTTFQVIFISLLNLIFLYRYNITMQELPGIPLIAFCGTLPMLIFYRSEKRKPPSRAETIIIKIVHFILTAGAVFALLISFGWIDAVNAIFIIVFFLIIYASIYIVLEVRANRLAKQINERINEIHRTENETHGG